MLGNFTFWPDEAGIFGPDVSFFAKYIKFSAPILSGNFGQSYMYEPCQSIVIKLRVRRKLGNDYL